MKKIKAYCAKKGVKPSFKTYFIDAMGAMALGLFASLLIGTIFSALGMIPGLSIFSKIGEYCGYLPAHKEVYGAAMAVAIAFALKAPPLVIYSAAAVGCAANDLGGAGGPLAVLFIAIVAVEIGKLVSKTTKVDIIVTPFVTIFTGAGLAILVAPYFGKVTQYISTFVNWATLQTPILMGILVSVVIGIALTLPISSAAICAGLNLTGMMLVEGVAVAADDKTGVAMAGAAAVAGCCAQMVGFAVMSFRENGWGGLVSQGLGTSMLQMPNIVKKPIVWLPPTIASAITGPLALCVFDMKMYGTGIFSGMGTCGLLGPIGLAIGWTTTEGVSAGTLQWIGLALICFLLPAIITWLIGELFRKLGWIKYGDLKLEL